MPRAPPLEAVPSAPAEPDPTAVEPVEPAETQVAAVEPEPLRPAETTAEPIMAEEVEQLTEEVVVAARLPRPRPDVVPEPRRAEAPARPTRQRKPAPEKPPTRTAAAAPPAAPSAPVAAPRQAVAHRAPSAGATAARSSVSPDRWKSAVVRHLERRKRYPGEAERAHVTGTVRVRFTIDANGNILRHRITGSSGHAVLDQAVADMIRRSSPVPAPPPDAFRPGLSLEVPIRFTAR